MEHIGSIVQRVLRKIASRRPPVPICTACGTPMTPRVYVCPTCHTELAKQPPEPPDEKEPPNA
jgi:hypothetical protein